MLHRKKFPFYNICFYRKLLELYEQECHFSIYKKYPCLTRKNACYAEGQRPTLLIFITEDINLASSQTIVVSVRIYASMNFRI